eukprot:CAMPEP_0182418592 /NCGR_PEP_ID=MMETSP1167-20130531/2979_1 /TAXON_ID=2988 /ORGANISM="Mallomonas Sp, Strain CCMP3275" /LENGTH=622 /DNA_ID=CAMNT_0024592867 /DNA_START=123 /DNA_END=1991 /DNA_ORIENTATION=-
MKSELQADRGFHSAVDGLLAFASPKKHRELSSATQNESAGAWTECPELSPMSSYDSTSPRPNSGAFGLSSSSPLNFPFSPQFFSQTPGGISTCSATWSETVKKFAEPSSPGIFSPWEQKPRSLQRKDLFSSDVDVSLTTIEDVHSNQSRNTSPYMRSKKSDYHPIDVKILKLDGRSDRSPSPKKILNEIKAEPTNRSNISHAITRQSKRNGVASHLFDQESSGTTLQRTASIDTNDELHGENISLPPRQKPHPQSKTDLIELQTASIHTSVPAVMCDKYATPDGILASDRSFHLSPQEERQCNCKQSKCLKLYCECFQVQGYCGDNCRCIDCFNLPQNEAVRQEAIQATKDRNIKAFEVKVSSTGHASGCKCKKSKCLKKYCECFQGSVFCGPACQCQSCSNYEGSKELDAALQDKEKKAQPKEKKEDSAKKKKLPEFEKEERNRLLQRSATKRCLRSDSFGDVDSDAYVSRYTGEKRTLLESASAEYDVPSESTMRLNTRFHTANQPITRSHSHLSETRREGLAVDSTPIKKETSRGSFMTPSPTSTDAFTPRSGPLKKRLLQGNAQQGPVYEFFGSHLPHTNKLTALKVLEMLENKDIYSMSLVNKLWGSTSMDEALWED